MTNEEINRAVAESVGWELVPLDGREFAGIPVMVWKRPDGEIGFPIPYYCCDLNAMHEVVCKLPDGEPRDCFLRELQIITQTWEKVDNDEDDDWLWHSVNATARQRAEAYLRTIGKWRDA